MAVSEDPKAAGLTKDQAAAKPKYGANTVPDGISFGGCLWEAFSSLTVRLMIISVLLDIVFILLGMLDITPLFGRYPLMFAKIAAAVITAFIGGILRYVSGKTLWKSLCPYPNGKYKVSRGMDTAVIPAAEISAGDVVFLSEGEIIPADGIIIDGDLTVEPAAPGNSAAAEKIAVPYGHSKNTTDTKDPYSIFAGSAILRGKASELITAVGKDTAYAKRLEDFSPEIPEKDFYGFIRPAAVIGAIAAAAALIFSILSGISADSVISGIVSGLSAMSAVLAVVCAGGKAVVFEALAADSLKILEKEEIYVNKGECLVSAGNTDVLMTERTGMITSGEFAFSGFIDGNGKEYGSFSEIKDGLAKFAEISVTALCGTNSGIDKVISGALENSGKNNFKKQSETSGKDISGITVTTGNSLVTFIKGGSDAVLDRCNEYLDGNGKKRKFTNKDALRKLADTILLSGKDIAAFAFSDKGIKSGKLPENGYVLIGLAAVQDRYPEETVQAVKKLEKAGVKTLPVTSASRRNTIFTVKFADIKKSGGVIIDTEQFEKMSPSQAGERFDNINAAAGFSGKDKARLVKTAKLKGKSVFFAGNSMEDRSALEAADTSFAAWTADDSLGKICGAAAGKLGIVCAERLISVSHKFSSGYKAFIIVRMLAAAALSAAAIVIGW